MHRILIIIFLLTIINCKQSNSIKKSSETNSKTELNLKKLGNEVDVFYSRIELDTVKYSQDLKIENTNHKLELKLYSLNDSSIIIETKNLKEIYHNSAFEILLTNNKDTVLLKKLTKENFKDSLDFNDYKTLTLSEIGYENIRSNRIYFTIGFNVPIAPINYFYKSCDLGIFYRTDKKGDISFGNFKDGRE